MISLLNLHLSAQMNSNHNSLSKMKTKSGSDYSEEGECKSGKKVKKTNSSMAFNATIQDNPEDNGLPATFKDTLPDADFSDNLAFEIVFLYDPVSFSNSNEPKKLEGVDWDASKTEFLIERKDFMFLPEQVFGRLSKEHALVTGVKQTDACKEANNLAFGPTLQDNNMGPTLIDSNVEDSEQSSNALPFSFELMDKSTNGTFILKRHQHGILRGPEASIAGDFKLIKKNNTVVLEHGDIIGLVMKKPKCTELQFGFQFLCKYWSSVSL